MSSEQTGDQATEQAGDQPTDQTASQPGGEPADQQGEQQVVIVGPDGKAVGTVPASMLAAAAGGEDAGDEAVRNLNDLVEQPAKVMRIGSMIRQLLEEVKAAPLDEASRARLKEIHAASIKELEQGLAPELVDELERLSLPFADGATPSEGELRIAQAQLVGWLEGLFHGIQTAIYAQQLAARAQFEQMRRALPGGAVPGMPGQPGQPPMGAPGQPQQAPADDDRSSSGGMYL
ncbi:bacterial proteasome activator family protein [Nocardioides sp. GXZ039]|uniref:bacterial proteasome activator family protein n=1 Tax=Nocardioides sp. GXZ039 TaxID=3136018 RepID=UPI0030F4B007